METVFARLAPLEAKLAAVEGRLGGLDPAGGAGALRRAAGGGRGAGGGGARGCDGAGGAPENPFAEISEQLTRLYAQKDAAVETMVARLAPLEARLAELERTETDDVAEAARAEAQAIATQLIAARAVAEETRLFSDRIALLEASLPRLSHAQALMMQALERQAAPAPGAAAWPLAAAVPGELRAEPPAAAAPAAEPGERRRTRSGSCRGSSRCTRAERVDHDQGLDLKIHISCATAKAGAAGR